MRARRRAGRPRHFRSRPTPPRVGARIAATRFRRPPPPSQAASRAPPRPESATSRRRWRRGMRPISRDRGRSTRRAEDRPRAGPTIPGACTSSAPSGPRRTSPEQPGRPSCPTTVTWRGSVRSSSPARRSPPVYDPRCPAYLRRHRPLERRLRHRVVGRAARRMAEEVRESGKATDSSNCGWGLGNEAAVVSEEANPWLVFPGRNARRCNRPPTRPGPATPRRPVAS